MYKSWNAQKVKQHWVRNQQIVLNVMVKMSRWTPVLQTLLEFWSLLSSSAYLDLPIVQNATSTLIVLHLSALIGENDVLQSSS